MSNSWTDGSRVHSCIWWRNKGQLTVNLYFLLKSRDFKIHVQCCYNFVTDLMS